MSSPRTPRHSRHPSAIDAFASPESYGSRTQSRNSIQSPITPARPGMYLSDGIGVDIFSSGGPGAQPNGLGNLADELADAWDEDCDGEEDKEDGDMNFHQAEGEEEVEEEEDEEEEIVVELTRDSGVDVSSSPLKQPLKAVNLSPLQTVGRGHKRHPSEYDGSDYGGSSDLESDGIPAGLLAKMDTVESLARRGTESNGTDRDGVVQRVIETLKNLGGQSGVEASATRLITAHTALSTHVMHQSRVFQSLAYSLFSPVVILPDAEFIDQVIPLLGQISESMPRPLSAAFNSLTQLHSLTSDLVQTLNYLSDTLHMSRQTTTTATRRLRSARELVAEMRKDDDAREEGERWLRRHNWSERLGARECASVCGDVLGGFDEVCNNWRARLVAQAEVVGA